MFCTECEETIKVKVNHFTVNTNLSFRMGNICQKRKIIKEILFREHYTNSQLVCEFTYLKIIFEGQPRKLRKTRVPFTH